MGIDEVRIDKVGIDEVEITPQAFSLRLDHLSATKSELY